MGSKFIAFIVLILSLLLVFSCGRSAFGPGDGDGGAEDAGQDGSDSDIACEVTGDCPEGYQCKNGRCLLGWTTTSVLETGNIAVGLNGEVYIAGTFQGDFDFDPGPNEDRHSSIGARDGYILTLSALGEYKRTVFFSGSIESDSLK